MVTEKAKEARQRAEALFRKQERAAREVDAARAKRTAQAEATEEKTARLGSRMSRPTIRLRAGRLCRHGIGTIGGR